MIDKLFDSFMYAFVRGCNKIQRLGHQRYIIPRNLHSPYKPRDNRLSNNSCKYMK